MYSEREFSRRMVAATDSVTEPVQVGSDGIAVFAAYTFINHVTFKCYYGVQFQMNITSIDESPDRHNPGWVGISNVGDNLGRFGSEFNDNVGAVVSDLPEGTWVRGHVYRLDGAPDSTCWLAVRTSA